MKQYNNSQLTKYCYDTQSTYEWLDNISQSHYSNEKLNITKMNNVISIPDVNYNLECFSGGLFYDDYSPIYPSLQRKGSKTISTIINQFPDNIVESIDEEVVYLGQFRNQWGNFIVDSISRLWFCLDEPRKYKYVYLATGKGPHIFHKNIIEFFNLLGIDEHQIILIVKPTYLKSVIMPDMSLIPFKEWHEEYKKIIHKVVSNAKCDIDIYDNIFFQEEDLPKIQLLTVVKI